LDGLFEPGVRAAQHRRGQPVVLELGDGAVDLVHPTFGVQHVGAHDRVEERAETLFVDVGEDAVQLAPDPSAPSLRQVFEWFNPARSSSAWSREGGEFP
jgi:hypothetical protein